MIAENIPYCGFSLFLTRALSLRIVNRRFAALRRFLSSRSVHIRPDNPRQLKPMATSVRASCVLARTNNYLWHDCQLNIVPAPNIARLSPPPLHAYISLFPSLSPLAPGVQGVWLRQATAATCVAEQTVFIHPRHTTLGLFTPCLSHPLSILLPLRASLRLSLSLALFELPTQPGDSVYSGVNFALQTRTNHCRCNCMQLSPSTFFPIWFKVPVENYTCAKECVCVPLTLQCDVHLP